MKKRIVLFPLFCLLATVGCLAQFTPNDSIRGKIREIKLSGAFVYAEASSMTNADEAQEVSLGKLEAGAISMMAENQMDKESIKNAWGKAKDKAVVMTYKNGTLFKVFSCLPKSALLGEPSAAEAMVVLTPPAGEKVLASLAPAEKPVADVPDSVAVSAGSEAVAPDVPEAVDSTLVADAVPAVEPVQVDTVAQVIVPKAAAPVNPLGEAAQATGQVYRGQTKSGEEALRDASTAQLIALLAQDSASEAKPEKADPAGEPERAGQPETGPERTEANEAASVENQSVPAATAAAAPEAVADVWSTMPEKEQRALKDLLNLDTYESVMMYLSSMKEDGRLMYGSLKKIIRPERSFLIVIKEGRLETILNKGKGDRINLRTLQAESVRNYIGCGIIWLQVFN